MINTDKELTAVIMKVYESLTHTLFYSLLSRLYVDLKITYNLEHNLYD